MTKAELKALISAANTQSAYMANDKTLEYDKANCRDMETEIFFMPESELQMNGVALKTLRQICFDCPIQDACAKYAFKYERHGMWGGFTERERQLIQQGRWEHDDLLRMYQQIKSLGAIVANIWDYAAIKPRYIDWDGEGDE